MNTLESINVAIEFVSKQVDPGGGGINTPAAQTGDFAIFGLIALVLTCVLAFAILKVSGVYNFSNATVGNHVRNKKAYRGGGTLELKPQLSLEFVLR